MKIYNPKDWVNTLFQIHKIDTVRKLFPMICIIALYAAAIAYLEIEVLKISDKSFLKQTTLMHSLLGFALSILLVFRTNTAYDRWWEGRRMWGVLVNQSRVMMMHLKAILQTQHATELIFFKKAITLFPQALISHLQSERVRLLLDEDTHEELLKLDKKKHLPNQILLRLHQRIVLLHEQKILNDMAYLNLQNNLQELANVVGSCERIKNTPIPFSYSAFLKKFIFVFIMTMPFGYALTMGYWVIPVVSFIFYVVASLEIIAEEIEDPFGMDNNDLPLNKIAGNIKIHIEEIVSS